ncbi:MAG: hypothetical protein ACOX3Y_05755 [Clostridia bacterium]
MRKEGVDTIILGCTELPLIADKYPMGPDYIDSTAVLAKRAVELARDSARANEDNMGNCGCNCGGYYDKIK